MLEMKKGEHRDTMFFFLTYWGRKKDTKHHTFITNMCVCVNIMLHVLLFTYKPQGGFALCVFLFFLICYPPEKEDKVMFFFHIYLTQKMYTSFFIFVSRKKKDAEKVPHICYVNVRFAFVSLYPVCVQYRRRGWLG